MDGLVTHTDHVLKRVATPDSGAKTEKIGLILKNNFNICPYRSIISMDKYTKLIISIRYWLLGIRHTYVLNVMTIIKTVPVTVMNK